MGTINQEKPLTVIKPVFLGWALLIRYLPLQINLTFVGGIVGGGIGFMLMLFFNLPYPIYAPFALCASVLFIGTPVVVYFIGHRTYAKTDYRFYKNRLEYAEGFWTINERVIQYKNITEVILRKTMVQRVCGLGTIVLLVPTGLVGGGIELADIRNPDAVYLKVQQIIQESSE